MFSSLPNFSCYFKGHGHWLGHGRLTHLSTHSLLPVVYFALLLGTLLGFK